MKYCAVTLVILAAVFIHQNEASVSPVLNHFNKTVHMIKNSLQSRKVHLVGQGTEKFEAYLDMAVADVSHSVEAISKEFEGIQPAECFATLDQELDDVKTNVTSKLEKCVHDHSPNWTSIEGKFDELIVRGNEIVGQINKIEAECASHLVPVARLCITMRVPKVTISVGLYGGAVGKLEAEFQVTTGLALTKFGGCIFMPLWEFRRNLKVAEENAKACAHEMF